MEMLIKFELISQLLIISPCLLEFDGNLDIGLSINSLVDLREASLFDFT